MGALLSPTDPVLSSARGHEPARAADRPPLAQPGVGPERRPGAAGRAGLHAPPRPATRTSCGGSSCFRTCSSASLSGLVRGLRRLAPDAAGRALGHSISSHQKALYALGVAFAAYGIGDAAAGGQRVHRRVRGAIALGIWRPGHPRVLRGAERGHRRDREARRLRRVRRDHHARRAVRGRVGGRRRSWRSRCSSLARSRCSPRSPASRQVDTAEKAFMAWFGPKGVATMAFALFVLGSAVPEGERIFEHRRARGARLDRCARPHRPRGCAVDHPPESAKRGDAWGCIWVVGCHRASGRGLGITSTGGFHALLSLTCRGHRNGRHRCSSVPSGCRGGSGSVGGGRRRRSYRPASKPSRAAAGAGAGTPRAATGAPRPGTRARARAEAAFGAICPRAQPPLAESARAAKGPRECPRAGRVPGWVVAFFGRPVGRRFAALGGGSGPSSNAKAADGSRKATKGGSGRQGDGGSKAHRSSGGATDGTTATGAAIANTDVALASAASSG